ncbi:MAG: MFS transporter, partial [Phycisphaerales bacterium]|nr:MFS transporter [Phycisphaerales bacterium]
KRTAEEPLAFLKAFSMLRHPGFLIVTLAALPIAMIHQVYFIRTAPFLGSIGFETQYAGPIMSIGQVSEIFFLMLLGLFIKKFGYRGTLVLGCAAYFARFAVFALANEETRHLVLAANALHGLCYGCFFAAAYIYVERVSPADIRHSAQTVFGIIILGVGPVLAGFYNGFFDQFTTLVDGAEVQSFKELWWSQAIIAAIVAIFVAVWFRSGLRERTKDVTLDEPADVGPWDQGE